MPHTHTHPCQHGPTADADFYFSYSLGEMTGICRSLGLWGINLLILTVKARIFKAETRI